MPSRGGVEQVVSDAHVLRLRLLGPAQIEAGQPPLQVDLAAHKGAALLFYLAARPDQAVTRTRLIALLWEASDEQEGRNSLSTALSRLRRALPNAPIVPVGDSLAWRPDANPGVWTDLAAFAELTRPGASRDALDHAVELWRGPFLEGFDLRGCADWDEWLNLERTTWQQRMLDALGRADVAGGHAPIAIRPRRSAEQAAPKQPEFPLVGRQAPLGQLLTAAEDAADGRGRLVVVEGEEGIGKSRLVEELVWLLDGEPARGLRPTP